MFQSVWCRSSRPLPAPRRSRKRSSSRSAISLIDSPPAGGGQLDRQWQPVQTVDDFHANVVVLAFAQLGARSAREGRTTPRPRRVAPTCNRNDCARLAPQAPRGAAQDDELRTTGQEHTDQARDLLQQMFAVVQHQQQVTHGEGSRQRLDHRQTVLLHRTDCLTDDEGRRTGFGQRRELDDPHPVGEPPQLMGCRFECQSGLARAAHARQRHQARRSQQFEEVTKLAVATTRTRRGREGRLCAVVSSVRNAGKSSGSPSANT